MGGTHVAVGRYILIFGRCRGSGDEFAFLLGVLNEPAQTEVGGTLHERISHSMQVVFVLCKLVTFPQRVNQPGTAHVPVSPHGAVVLLAYGVTHSPDVAVMACTPALVDAIEVACRVLSVVSQRSDEVVQRVSHFAEVGHKGGPVVLLQVNVERVVAVPWRPKMGRPKALQVSRHALGARRTNEQVASELEVECL